MNYNEIFKVLSDSNRLHILSLLHKNGELCGCELHKNFDITQPTFAYHMKLLCEVNLVSCYKKGTWCIYKINYKTIDNLKEVFDTFNFNK